MAKISKIGVEFGVSQAKGPNNWLKATASMEIEFNSPEDENQKEEIWEGAWDRVTEEVSKQLTKLDAQQ